MNSITKTKLTKEQIERLVAQAFGEAKNITAIEEFNDGWFNSIYSISFEEGGEVVLKVSPPSDIKVLRYEKDIMNTEVKVMQLLRASTDLPVPEVYYYDRSRTLLDIEYYFMEKIKGIAYSKVKEKLTEEQRQLIERQLGACNRKLNEIKGDRFGSLAVEEKTGESWAEVFLGMVRDVLRDGEEYEVKLPYEYKHIEELFAQHKASFDKVNVPSLVHWDLHDGNVFVNESCDKIVGIIDFERAFYGDPLMEIYFGQFCDRRNFVEGYGKDLIASKEEERRRILYDLYLDLIMVIESKYRQFENEEHVKWAYGMVESDVRRLEENLKERG
jgi:aminoglycoside phosphotransferase (APT) family kinase protein